MNKRSKIIVRSLVLGIFLMLTACAKEGTKQVTKEAAKETLAVDTTLPKEEGKIIIGATIASGDSSYLVDVCAYMKEAAKKADIELILKFADWDAQVQAEQLDDFVKQGVDGIILCPVNAKSMLVPLKKVQKEKIPVINLNMRVDAVSTIYTDTYVGASNSQEGALAADLIKRIMDGKGGKIGIIEGSPGSDAQIYRTQTFIEQLMSSPEIEVAAIGNGGWDREQAALVTGDLLGRYPDIKAIYCHDSNMALGAIEKLEALQLQGQVQVIGISENAEYLEAVKAQRLYGFISQPAWYEGTTSIEKAVDAVNGKQLRPWYKDPIQSVTQDNVESFENMQP